METYWKFLLIGIGVLILGIIGLVLGVPKDLIKNKTAKDAALWIGIILTVIGVIIIGIGLFMYFRRNSKRKALAMQQMNQQQMNQQMNQQQMMQQMMQQMYQQMMQQSQQ